MELDNDELLTLDEAGRVLKVSKEQIRALIKCGRLPYVPVGTGKVRMAKRVRRGDLLQFTREVRRENDLRIIRRLRERHFSQPGCDLF